MRAYRDTKTEAVSNIIKKTIIGDINKILVVGCGTGVEAAILAECLDAKVTGIDVEDNFYSEAKKKAVLLVGDATSLDFDDESFDFVYSYHSLEHMNDPVQALREMKRVLLSDGSYWVGTPNRSRFLGYLGSKDATIWEKIKWNYVDWKARLSGKFKNEYGAHAGFSEKELGTMLRGVFSETNSMTSIYFHEIYKKYKTILLVLEKTRFSTIAYPSVYFMGKK